MDDQLLLRIDGLLFALFSTGCLVFYINTRTPTTPTARHGSLESAVTLVIGKDRKRWRGGAISAERVVLAIGAPGAVQ